MVLLAVLAIASIPAMLGDLSTVLEAGRRR
jgi:hypothetical protein